VAVLLVSLACDLVGPAEVICLEQHVLHKRVVGQVSQHLGEDAANQTKRLALLEAVGECLYTNDSAVDRDGIGNRWVMH